MTTEIVKRDEVEVTVIDRSPAGMMQTAMANGSSLESIEKMMELQERWEKNEAKKAYVSAMAAFKKESLVISKNKKVEFGNTKYSHATLGHITSVVGPELSKHGLSASWETNQGPDGITVTCIMTHSMGHSEKTSLTAPADVSGKKNSIQAIGSTVSYLQRYTYLSITGQSTHDQDDDGIASELQCIDGKQASQIIDMMNSKGIDHEQFFNWLKVDGVENIPLKRFGEVMNVIKQTEVTQ